MLNEVTKEMKRQTRDQASRLEQQINEMESILAEIKASLDTVSEFGACAVRGVSERGTAEQLARTAVKMGKSMQSLSLIADFTDAANAGTCEEVGA